MPSKPGDYRTAPPDDIEVTLCCLADAANVSIEGKLNVLGAFDIIWAGSGPVVWPLMFFVAQLKVSTGVGETNRFQVRCVDEDGNLVHIIAEFEARADGPSKVPGVAGGFPLTIGIQNALLPDLGTYRFELWRGEDFVCSADLHVLPPPSPAGT